MIYNHQGSNIKLLMIGGSFYGNEMESSSFINNLRTQFTDIQDRIIFTGLKYMKKFLQIWLSPTLPYFHLFGMNHLDLPALRQ